VIGGDDRLAEMLRRRYGLRRLVLHMPAMGLLRDPAARQACVDFVLAHPARYVFLAVGAPQSEVIAAQIRAAGGTGIGLCIGSSLHFAVGLVQRAPVWIQWCGLEWAYRLMQSPRGHFRRVFGESVPMVWLLLRARFGDPEPLRRGRHGGG
jgi:exopolysaccharide biosynthesis WecB/TagA/CpsF family protein